MNDNPTNHDQHRDCGCAKADAIYWADRPEGFDKTFIELEYGDWVKLARCSVCGQYWSIDEWDKYQHQIAVKIANVTGWRAEGEQLRKQLLLKSRGGLTDATCIRAGCSNRAVKSVAYCIDHLYEVGVRR